MSRSRLLDNARTFYQLFRANKLTPEIDQEEAIACLEQIFKDRHLYANSTSMAQEKRDGYMFFQGAYVGLLIMSKAYITHLKASAAEQNITLPVRENSH
jgi:hypothetical protein